MIILFLPDGIHNKFVRYFYLYVFIEGFCNDYDGLILFPKFVKF